MSIENYLNIDEEIKFIWDIYSEDKKIRINKLGVTTKRIFHFTIDKKRDRIYRDIPIRQVKYIENQWHKMNLIKLIIGIIFLSIGLGFSSMGFNVYFQLGGFISIPFFLIGIYFILKGIRQYGYILINTEGWKFYFKKNEDLTKIENFIKIIYSLESSP